jgi:hypothetical protein
MTDKTVAETHGTKKPDWPVGPVAVRLALLVVLAGLMAGLYLWQASETATTGRRIEMLRQRKLELERENAELVDQIAVEGSLPRLQERASKLGFVPTNQAEFLPVTAIPPDTAPTLRADLAAQWAARK